MNWTLTGIGDDGTIDHFTVFVSKDAANLMPIGNVNPAARSLDLTSFDLEPGTYQVYVKAVGRPSLLNHMSNAVTFALSAPETSSAADYSIITANANLTVTAAKPASMMLSTAANGFSGTVSFSCSALPSWAQCSFTPATIAVGGGTTLVIRVIQSASLAPAGFAGMLLMLSLFAGMGIRSRAGRKTAVVFTIFAITTAMGACGGGAQQSSAAPQNQTSQSSTSAKILVTATPSDQTIELK